MRTVFEVICLKSTGGGVSVETKVAKGQTWPHKKGGGRTKVGFSSHCCRWQDGCEDLDPRHKCSLCNFELRSDQTRP